MKRLVLGTCIMVATACAVESEIDTGADSVETQQAESAPELAVAANSALETAQTTAITADIAHSASLFRGVISLLGHEAIRTVIDRVKSETTLSPTEEASLWDFYKAANGIDFDESGHQIPGTGAKRRAYAKLGESRILTLLSEGKRNAELRNLAWTIDQGVMNLFHLAAREVSGETFDLPFRIYSKGLSDAQRAELENSLQNIMSFLGKIPKAHSQVLDPMIVVDKLAGGRTDGGGHVPPASVANWIGKSATTGVPDQDIKDYAAERKHGLIAFTTRSILDPTTKWTLLHEAAHCIETNFTRLVPAGTTSFDLRGQRYPNEQNLPEARLVREYTAEAYSRYYVDKSNVCRRAGQGLPPDETLAQCNRRTIELLRRGPAFAGIDLPF